MKLGELLRTKGKILHFTHAADADGIGCEALMQCLPDDIREKITTIRCGYGDFLKNVSDIINDPVTYDSSEYIGIVVTDLGVNPNVLNALRLTKIPYVWIDHHPLKVDLDDAENGEFVILEDVYMTAKCCEAFSKDTIFNPTQYGGMLKYSATAILYMELRKCGFLEFKETNAQEQFEAFVIKSLSDSDTFAFKNLKDPAPYWITLHSQEENVPVSKKFIVDPWPLLMKNEGAESVIFAITSIYHALSQSENSPEYKDGIQRNIVDLLLVPAKRYHNNRLTRYSGWEKTAAVARFKTETESHAFMFSPRYEGDFSMFSDWFLSSHPEFSGTMAIDPVTRILQFRSLESSNVNVGKLATDVFGGGGHVHASGATASMHLASDMLMDYWVSKRMENEMTTELTFIRVGDEVVVHLM